MASAVKKPDEPDHVLKGNVVVEGSLIVNGVKTGTALAAGDVPKGAIVGPHAGMYCVGRRLDEPEPLRYTIGGIEYPLA